MPPVVGRTIEQQSLLIRWDCHHCLLLKAMTFTDEHSHLRQLPKLEIGVKELRAPRQCRLTGSLLWPLRELDAV